MNKNSPYSIWVANRDNPINDTSGILSIDKTGNLVIHNGNDSIPFWSTNVSVAPPANTCSAQLLDSGNLILLHKSVVAWQGFDHPTDTMFPLMKIGVDRRTGLNRFLMAWKSPDDPGAGECLYKMDLNGSPQFFLSKGSVRLWRTGPWDGDKWSGIPSKPTYFVFNITYVDNDDEVFVILSNNASILWRFVVNESGTLEMFDWLEGDCRWVGFWSTPKDGCDSYGTYGTSAMFGNCNPPSDGKFECTCLPGFEPKIAHDWSLWDASGGCVSKRGGDTCRNGEGFVLMIHSNIPYATVTRVNISWSLKECEEVCLKDCSCNGYTSADIRGGGSGCVTWHSQLMYTRVFSDGGQEKYIRVDAVELESRFLKKTLFFGPWNRVKYSGIPLQTSNFVFRTTYVDNDDEVFIIGSNESVLSSFVMNESGTVEVHNWLEGDHRWVGYWSAPKDRYDPFGPYGTCGLFGNCNPPSDGKFECTCLPGFEPKFASDWSLWDASGGCVRKHGGDTCQNGEGFMPLTHSNIPYATMTHVNISLSLKECE
ncbi:G-type lectin S-receptor-like serine/threonine-protein kinase RKS1 [Cornus florida]|uniref:G-type lectin S-receptor-like serine/threonine-protein kinase RKS1 n=1 Tax=Cornus florida TaxID=4283 RepID=UPI002899F658|nr:G-type lectin S-receptor-like serine/threonine-protein kinase RKS1 [Cornus florida]